MVTTIKTEENYNFNENDFQIISEQSHYMNSIYSDIISTKHPKKILDVGCGNGHFSSLFLKANISIDGIDGSKDALENCKKIGFEECFYTENIDNDNLESINKKYDLIICKDFLEHLLYPEKLVQNLKSKLTENGRILVHVPNHFPLFYRLKFLFTGDLDTQNYFPGWKEWNNPHIRFFSYKGIIELLTTNGYKVQKDYSKEFFYFAPYLISFCKAIGLHHLLISLSTNLFSAGFSILASKEDNDE